MSDIKKALLIVDVQNDFVTGSLGSEYAKDVVVPNIVELAKQFKKEDIYATMDTHFHGYLKTQEGQRLPVEHCISGTWGHNLVPEIDALVYNVLAYNRIIKLVFGMDRDKMFNLFKDYDEVHICGLVTDICVVTNALGFKSNSHLDHIRIIVHENCCGGTSKEAHDAAITVMKSCQIDIE